MIKAKSVNYMFTKVFWNALHLHSFKEVSHLLFYTVSLAFILTYQLIATTWHQSPQVSEERKSESKNCDRIMGTTGAHCYTKLTIFDHLQKW